MTHEDRAGWLAIIQQTLKRPLTPQDSTSKYLPRGDPGADVLPRRHDARGPRRLARRHTADAQATAHTARLYHRRSSDRSHRKTLPVSTFHVVTPERTYCLAAMTHEDRAGWLAVIQQTLKRPLTPQDSTISTFHVVTPERTYCLAAMTHEDRAGWLAVIQQTLKRPLTPQDSTISTFHVVTPERTYCLAAMTHEDRAGWLAVIQQTLKRPLTPQDSTDLVFVEATLVRKRTTSNSISIFSGR
ncbi:unnamed protein product [Plutella xylostella]|uniref:(diamondback moth) hypothetical protein n=1 Tax=Plutella xylostella TaxID=51655 RepID=A0A8S4CXX9_PLUXY|nr:unnamed protein product [Plutella xylostella]